MRYVVIGAGAVGGTLAARLYEAGREVLLVARGRHLDALRERGLQFDDPDRSRTLPLPVVAIPSDIDWRYDDVVFLSTKTQDSENVLDALRAAFPEVPVICAQNGVANERFTASRFTNVQSMCVMLPAEHLEPGRVVAYSAPVPGILDVGTYPQGTNELTAQIATDLRAAGFSSRADNAIMRWKYRKLLRNLGNAAEAACGGQDPDLITLDAMAQSEGERCLAAAGIALVSTREERERRGDLISLRIVGGRTRRGGSSWQSLERRTRSIETEFLNGEIVTLGRQFGVPTPVNAMLQQVVVSMAHNNEPPGNRRAVDLLTIAHPAPSSTHGVHCFGECGGTCHGCG